MCTWPAYQSPDSLYCLNNDNTYNVYCSLPEANRYKSILSHTVTNLPPLPTLATGTHFLPTNLSLIPNVKINPPSHDNLNGPLLLNPGPTISYSTPKFYAPMTGFTIFTILPPSV